MAKRKRKRKSSAKHGQRKRRAGHSGKKMPSNVLKYFKLRGQGKSKAEARKLAGMGKSKGKTGRKKWGPGNPLYEWQKKHKK